MTLYLIAMVYYIVYMLLFLYLAYYSFILKPIFFSRYLYGWLLMSFFVFNPLNLHGIFNVRSLLSLMIFVGLSILFIFFITKGHEDSYQFINAIKDPKKIAEHALSNLDISYESLEDSTRIVGHEDTALLYIKPKNECISFRKVQDKTLQKRIIQEIRKIMDAYKKPSKTWGLIYIFLILILIASAMRFISLTAM